MSAHVRYSLKAEFHFSSRPKEVTSAAICMMWMTWGLRFAIVTDEGAGQVICPTTGKSALTATCLPAVCQALRAKIFCFSEYSEYPISLLVPSHQRGVAQRHQRGAGCGGR